MHIIQVYICIIHILCVRHAVLYRIWRPLFEFVYFKSRRSDVTPHIYRYTRIKYINHIRIYIYILYSCSLYVYIALRPLSLVNSKRVEVRNTIYFTVRPSSVMGFHMYIYIYRYIRMVVPIFKRIVNTYILYIRLAQCTAYSFRIVLYVIYI